MIRTESGEIERTMLARAGGGRLGPSKFVDMAKEHTAEVFPDEACAVDAASGHADVGNNLWAHFGERGSGVEGPEAVGTPSHADYTDAATSPGTAGGGVNAVAIDPSTIPATVPAAKAWTDKDLAAVTAGQEAIGQALLELLESLQEVAAAVVVAGR